MQSAHGLWSLLTASLRGTYYHPRSQTRTLAPKAYATGPSVNTGTRTVTPSLRPPHHPPNSCLKPSFNLSHWISVPCTQQAPSKRSRNECRERLVPLELTQSFLLGPSPTTTPPRLTPRAVRRLSVPWAHSWVGSGEGAMQDQ